MPQGMSAGWRHKWLFQGFLRGRDGLSRAPMGQVKGVGNAAAAPELSSSSSLKIQIKKSTSKLCSGSTFVCKICKTENIT